jgi:hypothetical protein
VDEINGEVRVGLCIIATNIMTVVLFIMVVRMQVLVIAVADFPCVKTETPLRGHGLIAWHARQVPLADVTGDADRQTRTVCWDSSCRPSAVGAGDEFPLKPVGQQNTVGSVAAATHVGTTRGKKCEALFDKTPAALLPQNLHGTKYTHSRPGSTWRIRT